MFSANDFKNTIENSETYDTKLKFKNLNYDELLDKATGQHLLIKDLEKAHIEHIDEIIELRINLDDMTSNYYLQRDKNKNLETSLLTLSN